LRPLSCYEGRTIVRPPLIIGKSMLTIDMAKKAIASIQDAFDTAAASPNWGEEHAAYKGGLKDHTLNVVKYTSNLAATLPTPEEQEQLVALAWVHDLGKIYNYGLSESGKYYFKKGSPEHVMGTISILTSAGITLTPDETDILKCHHGPWKMKHYPNAPISYLSMLLFTADMQACTEERCKGKPVSGLKPTLDPLAEKYLAYVGKTIDMMYKGANDPDFRLRRVKVTSATAKASSSFSGVDKSGIEKSWKYANAKDIVVLEA